MIFIEEVQLENIKSYREARISFQEGVNFICGANGSGKTTIVEAIGYALFNYSPFTQTEFIRYGASRGTVRVTFVGADNNRYVSERRIARSGGGFWRLYEAESDYLLEEGVKDILDLFQNSILPIRGGTLRDLFKTMIGVPQGMLCVPFLEAPKERKSLFEAILQVDGYRKAFENTGAVGSIFKEKIASLNNRRADKETQTEGYDETKRLIEALVEERERLKTQEAEEEEERKTAQAELQRLEKRQLLISAAEQKQTRASGALDVKKAEAARLASDLEEAEEAEKVCAENADDHAAHANALRQIDALVQQQKKRDGLQTKLTEKEQERAKTETRIQTVQESVDQTESELKEKLRNAEGEIEAELPGKQEIESAVADASDQRRYWEDVFKKSHALRERLPSLGALLQLGNRAAEAIQRSVEQRETLIESLSRYEEAKAVAETFEAAEEKRNSLRDQLSQLQAQAEEAKRRQEEAKDGLCPILRAPCQNIGGGDLSLHIVSGLEQIEAKMREPQAELTAAEETMKKASEAKEELNRLEKIQDQIAALENTEKERRDEVETARAEIEWESWKREADSLETELGDSAPEAAAGLQRFHRHLASAENGSTDNLELWTAQIQEALRKIQNSIDEVNESVERHVQQAESAQKDGTTALQGYLVNLENLEKKKRDIAADLEKVNDTRAQLKTDIEGLTATQSEIGALNENLKAYEGVDAQMQDARKTRDETSGGYQLYLQNEKAAKETGEVRDKLAQARRSQHAAEGELADAEKDLANLQSGFDPETLTTLRGRIETLNAVVANIASKISAGEEKLKNERKNLEDMEEALREIEKIDKEIDRNERAEKLAAFVRSRMLNVVGERISNIYRQKVAEQGSYLYRQISGDPQALLDWSKNYELSLTSAAAPRTFKQLSGGEQMSAALSVRLALLALLSEIGIAVFDEPTANLDDMRREQLAQALSSLRQQPNVQWRQLFIISHDDTFDNAVDTAIRIEKESTNGSGLAAEL